LARWAALLLAAAAVAPAVAAAADGHAVTGGVREATDDAGGDTDGGHAHGHGEGDAGHHGADGGQHLEVGDGGDHHAEADGHHMDGDHGGDDHHADDAGGGDHHTGDAEGDEASGNVQAAASGAESEGEAGADGAHSDGAGTDHDHDHDASDGHHDDDAATAGASTDETGDADDHSGQSHSEEGHSGDHSDGDGGHDDGGGGHGDDGGHGHGGGVHVGHDTPNPPLTTCFLPSAPGGARNYSRCQSLPGQVPMSLYWDVDEAAGTLTAAFTAQSIGWAAFAFNGADEADAMLSGDAANPNVAVVGRATGADTAAVGVYALRAKASAGVQPIGSGVYTGLTATRDAAGALVVGFTRPLAGARGAPAVPTDGTPVNAIWSTGPPSPSAGALRKHVGHGLGGIDFTRSDLDATAAGGGAPTAVTAAATMSRPASQRRQWSTPATAARCGWQTSASATRSRRPPPAARPPTSTSLHTPTRMR